jgi:L-alanine-DL-glutamate epimerase-like enolase superfamily enzyme
MKISGLTTRLLRIDCAARYRDGVVPPGRPKFWLFPLVTLHTDTGIDGNSMAYGPHGDGRALVELLHETYYPQIAGLDPRQSEAIWQKLWQRQRHLYNQSDTLVGVIDVAVWDLRGQLAQQPIAAMLGQFVDRLPAYMSAKSEAYSEIEIATEATGAKAAGYHGYKLQLRDGPAKDIPRLRAARAAVGDGFRLMQDPNSSYNLVEALEVGRVLDELAYHWYEEPLPETQIGNYRQLVATLLTPILATETSRLTDLPNFISGRAMTIARGDVLIKGGITGLRKAMAACELFGYNLEIHTANTPLLDVANLHVAAAARNTSLLEVHHPIFRFGLKQHPFNVGPDGCVHLPSGPGLGVELDWDWIENHTDEIRHSPATVPGRQPARSGKVT